MSFYITMPFGDKRAVVSMVEPTDHPYFIVDELPEGEGALMVEGETLCRVPIFIEEPNNPFAIVEAENKLLKAQLKAQTDRFDFLEDCLAEMAMIVYQTP